MKFIDFVLATLVFQIVLNSHFNVGERLRSLLFTVLFHLLAHFEISSAGWILLSYIGWTIAIENVVCDAKATRSRSPIQWNIVKFVIHISVFCIIFPLIRKVRWHLTRTFILWILFVTSAIWNYFVDFLIDLLWVSINIYLWWIVKSSMKDRLTYRSSIITLIIWFYVKLAPVVVISHIAHRAL
jgi:hypothetical protein